MKRKRYQCIPGHSNMPHDYQQVKESKITLSSGTGNNTKNETKWEYDNKIFCPKCGDIITL